MCCRGACFASWRIGVESNADLRGGDCCYDISGYSDKNKSSLAGHRFFKPDV